MLVVLSSMLAFSRGNTTTRCGGEAGEGKGGREGERKEEEEGERGKGWGVLLLVLRL